MARIPPAAALEVVAGLLSETNSYAVRAGLKYAADLARIVPEEEQGPVVAISPDTIRRVGAAFAAVIREEIPRFDWQDNPPLYKFIKYVYRQHPRAQEALDLGATLNARSLGSRT